MSGRLITAPLCAELPAPSSSRYSPRIAGNQTSNMGKITLSKENGKRFHGCCFLRTHWLGVFEDEVSGERAGWNPGTTPPYPQPLWQFHSWESELGKNWGATGTWGGCRRERKERGCVPWMEFLPLHFPSFPEPKAEVTSPRRGVSVNSVSIFSRTVIRLRYRKLSSGAFKLSVGNETNSQHLLNM